MAGRFAVMGAETGSTTAVATSDLASERSYRLVCALAALLCLLGVVSTTALRASEGVHHHRTAIAAVASATDGHATNPRTDRHAVTGAAHPWSRELLLMPGANASAESATVASVHSVGTRGPPTRA
jgi:hypothetical protein